MIAICPHVGQMMPVAANTRVLVSGQPVLTLGDVFLIAGCPFPAPATPPSPCIKVQWISSATRVSVNGQPVILQESTGLCLNVSQAPQGPLNVTQTQVRVKGL